jgi:hypothetical protein
MSASYANAKVGAFSGLPARLLPHTVPYPSHHRITSGPLLLPFAEVMPQFAMGQAEMMAAGMMPVGVEMTEIQAAVELVAVRVGRAQVHASGVGPPSRRMGQLQHAHCLPCLRSWRKCMMGCTCLLPQRPPTPSLAAHPAQSSCCRPWHGPGDAGASIGCCMPARGSI